MHLLLFVLEYGALMIHDLFLGVFLSEHLFIKYFLTPLYFEILLTIELFQLNFYCFQEEFLQFEYVFLFEHGLIWSVVICPVVVGGEFPDIDEDSEGASEEQTVYLLDYGLDYQVGRVVYLFPELLLVFYVGIEGRVWVEFDLVINLL